MMLQRRAAKQSAKLGKAQDDLSRSERRLSGATKRPAKLGKALPRSRVKAPDTWDLTLLFADDDAWEAAYTAWEDQLRRYARYRGRLGESPKMLAACLKFDLDVDRSGERLGNYAYLKSCQDTADSTYQRMLGRYRNAASRAAQESSFIRPQILAIPEAVMQEWLGSRPLAPYRLLLLRVIRYRPHTLAEGEERLLAMQSEMSQAASHVFRQLNNADLKFGQVRDERGERIELTHASFSALLNAPNRGVRRRAFEQYYQQFAAHENTLAAALGGSIQRDVYYAKARGHASSLAAALFPDQVPIAVYDNLIAAVRAHLPNVHRYYAVRRRKMRLDELHHYDTYVPILHEQQTRHTWNQAVDLVVSALSPLGSGYCQALLAGLVGRWCDRYENQGKQSGAFSSGSYDGPPFILMNYQSTVLDHVFTLAHEAGHSMHSYYSARNQPFAYYDYTIFVAEVASTFNEQLLSRHLLAKAGTRDERAFLINREIDAIRATLVRQTMFAEFEKRTHELAENNEPLTVERFKSVYRELLVDYFGPEFTLDEQLSIECLRIPHFYRAFYVYKYATGMSAAIALARRVVDGGARELADYLKFLSSGCSQDPLDLLRDAGVDMEQPAPVETALAHFGRLVDELDELL